MSRSGTERAAIAPDVESDFVPDEARNDGRSLRTAAMRAAAMGMVHSILFLAALGLMSTVPGPASPNAEIVEFYSSENRRRVVLVGLYLMPLAGVAFMWFIVSLRTWISANSPRENILYSNMQLVSGIIFTALFFASAAATSITAASVQYSDSGIDPVVARQFPEYGNALLLVFAIRMAAIFVFSTTAIGRSTGILPRWFLWVGYVVGIFLLLSVTFSWWLVLVFPSWVLVLSGLLVYLARQIPASARIPNSLARERILH
jgi:hypothetical protein